MCGNLTHNQDIRSIFLNIIGGVLVILLDRLYLYVSKTCKAFKFRKLFGGDIINEFYVVYGKMTLEKVYDIQGQAVDFPYHKSNGGIFRISEPVSYTETKSLKFLSESIVSNTNCPPKIISDDEIKEKLDISYCSLGGFSNFKSSDIVNAENNVFYTYNGFEIVSKKDATRKYAIDQRYDYAIIIKLSNSRFPNRTQICIAGIGESGTSGASWFLAYKWKELLKKVGSESFGCVVRVEFNKDESAEIVDSIKASDYKPLTNG